MAGLRETSGVENVPPSAATARLWSLDALRGLCALIVFLSHWHLWSSFPPVGTFEIALRNTGEFLHDGFALLTWPTGGHHPAVIGFFVLSGFCIHYPMERRLQVGATRPGWREYFGRRFRRIMPVYWAACALGLLFVALEAKFPSGHPLLKLHASSSVADMLVRFTGLAGLYPHEIFAGNYILTTVTVEILMYAAYPLIYRYAASGQWRALGLAFVALHLVAVAMLPFVTAFWVFNSVFMLGIFWFAGAYASHLFVTRRARVPTWWLLAAWAVFLALKATPYFYGLNLFKQAAWGAVCALGILWVLRWETEAAPFQDRWSARALRYCGDISYSLYAMHTPAIMLATWTLLRFGETDYAVQLAATLTASAIAVLGVHYGIERVFYNAARPGAANPAGATRTPSPLARS